MDASVDALTAEASPRTWAVPPGVVAVVAIGLSAGCLMKFESVGRAVVAAAFCSVLTLLSAEDIKRRIIPNRIVLPAGALVLLGNIAVRPGRAGEWAIAAFATMAGALLFSLATRGGLGMGDVKLAFLMGAGLGWHVLGAIVLAMLATFVVGFLILVRRGLSARKETIPLGPFLAFGAVLMLFLS